jgi:hypothetical protein
VLTDLVLPPEFIGRSGGLGELTTAFSLPTWIFAAGRGRVSWDSLQFELAMNAIRFKRLSSSSPLTLTLSPLRGEGIRGGSHKTFPAHPAVGIILLKHET